MLKFVRFTHGLLGSNTYLGWFEGAKEAFVIDAGNPAGPVAEAAAERGLTVKYIILTHAHYDHISDIDEYKAAFPGAKTVLHPLDDDIMDDTRLNASSLFGSEKRYDRADMTVEEGDVLELEGGSLTVLHTPGHTAGGICILAEGNLFSGDTLFYNSFGRTDLGCGDMGAMKASLARLFALPPETVVHPGHGIRTTVGREAGDNPILYY